MGLQNVEMVLLGYNTPLHNAPSPDHDEHSWFHNQLSMQAGAYQNGTWVVGVAKGARRRACRRSPTVWSWRPPARWWRGRKAQATNSSSIAAIRRRPELKRTTFNFAIHRQPDQYRMIVERKGAMDPS